MADGWPGRREPAAEDETRRLAAVRRYDVLDTPPDGSFDRITELAADLFAVPISIVSLVDHDRIWFKSHHGLDVPQIERAPGLCASAILQDEPWILTDAGLDPRALANPLVAGDFGLRFYVGVPLRTGDGFNLGTLCVIDREPRTVTEQQLRMLRHLAAAVMDQMELRLAARRAIGELSQVVAAKEAALQRSEILAKEIDHRLMNSLQLISGLLRLQSRAAGSEAGGQLGLATDRVSAIARVHQHIYSSEGIRHVSCKPYLQRLCADLAAMLPPGRQGALRVEGIEAAISTAQIVPLGLIVNELVTNAIKHGEGTVTVSLEERAPAGYALSVADEGGGLAADFDPVAGSLGMKVVSALVRQLRGQLVWGNARGSGGARFTVLFARPG
jgi:two-component sensor histidine kinase